MMEITLAVLVKMDNYQIRSGGCAHSAELAVHQALVVTLCCVTYPELSLLEDVGNYIILDGCIRAFSGTPAIGMGRIRSCSFINVF